MTDITFRHDMTVDLIDSMGTDESAVRAARVSTKGANDGQGGDYLIEYLVREGHWSPFMHTAFTVLVECPLSTRAQVFKHTVGVVFNETSGRYSELQPVFHLPSKARPLVQTGKVGHYTFSVGTSAQYHVVETARKITAEDAWASYQHQLSEGIAKEVARDVLPLSIYTSFYMTLNARSLMHFLDLRLDSHAQHEIQQVAQGLESILAETMPLTHAAWKAQS